MFMMPSAEMRQPPKLTKPAMDIPMPGTEGNEKVLQENRIQNGNCGGDPIVYLDLVIG